ncbi:MAG: hypothetical protein KDI90_08705 [Alphaproteobacteria bacterium]|nr:hypothetical protein [Alphaproteobacteria bacterium]
MTTDLDGILSRNARVEADKAWETSRTRRLIIALGTYAVVGLYLSLLGVQGAWLHALVPPAAYILSTLTLPLFKRLWIEKCYTPGKKTGDE